MTFYNNYIPSYPQSIAVTIGWSQGSYNATEGEDPQVLICGSILHGVLETTVTAPFDLTSQSTGM